MHYYDSNGLAQPPCCLKVLTGMSYAIVREFDRFNLSLCLYCGQVLAAIKMPGGQLPWDTDVDAPHYAKDFYDVVEKVVPALRKYGKRLIILTSMTLKAET